MNHMESKLTGFLEKIRYEPLPDSTVHEAKRALLDTLGCMIAGLDTPIGQKITKLTKRFVNKKGATVIGVSHRVTHFFASMCNSFMANALDADDGHRMSRLHAGGVMIPTVMAAAEENDCDGSEFLKAIVVGYELGLRAGMASTVGDIYFGSAFGSTFGAAAAAGWLLNLSHDQILNAMGISEMHAPNSMLMGWIGSRKIPMIKEGMGWSAATAIFAAYLAGEGITGTLTIFNECEKAANISLLGSDYEIERRYYKPGPGCRWTHAPLQTLLNIVHKHRLVADDVIEIQVRTFDKASQLDNPKPATIEEAEYSIPFVLGAAILEGEFGPDQMQPNKLIEPQILEQARKIKITEDPRFTEKYPKEVLCELTIKTTDGRIFSAKNQKVDGDWESRLSDKQLRNKFVHLTKNRLSRKQAQDVIKQVFEIESIKSIHKFINHLNSSCIE